MSATYRRNVVLVLMARFLFAYDCHLVNCAHYTRITARQRCVSDTTQEHQGRLTPRRAALAAELACLPVLVEAALLLAGSAKRGIWTEAHSLLLHAPRRRPCALLAVRMRMWIHRCDKTYSSWLAWVPFWRCGDPGVLVRRSQGKVSRFFADGGNGGGLA
jgi:hypothetical protein